MDEEPINWLQERGVTRELLPCGEEDFTLG
jgi:hypothetical protein